MKGQGVDNDAPQGVKKFSRKFAKFVLPALVTILLAVVGGSSFFARNASADASSDCSSLGGHVSGTQCEVSDISRKISNWTGDIPRANAAIGIDSDPVGDVICTQIGAFNTVSCSSDITSISFPLSDSTKLVSAIGLISACNGSIGAHTTQLQSWAANKIVCANDGVNIGAGVCPSGADTANLSWCYPSTTSQLSALKSNLSNVKMVCNNAGSPGGAHVSFSTNFGLGSGGHVYVGCHMYGGSIHSCPSGSQDDGGTGCFAFTPQAIISLAGGGSGSPSSKTCSHGGNIPSGVTLFGHIGDTCFYSDGTTDTAVVGGPSTPDAPDPTSGGSSASTCNVPGTGWILCPIATTIAKWVDDAYGAIKGILDVPVSILTDTGPGSVKGYWDNFITYANLILAIVFLAIIYSEATGNGFGAMNNYNIKKTLPKLIIFAVLVNISFWICAAMVDISNILGEGMINMANSVSSPCNTSYTSTTATVLQDGKVGANVCGGGN
jgi:hypothetical protein